MRTLLKKMTAIALANTLLLIGVIGGGMSVLGAGQDEFDALRIKWAEMLTGGRDYDPTDPLIAEQIESITNSAKSRLNSMNKDENRTYLWSSLASDNVSSQITSNYGNLYTMALAYATKGSELEGDKALLDAVIGGLEWMDENRYSARVEKKYDNWWDWEIGTPRHLLNILAMLYDDLPKDLLKKCTDAIERFTPEPGYTGANRVWVCGIVAVRGILVKDAAKVKLASDELVDVFAYVTSSDGFYEDGSFIQHAHFSYTGGYGNSLLSDISQILYLLYGSTWEVKDPSRENVYSWIYDSFEPVMYKGAVMDMVRGREIARYQSTANSTGKTVMTSLVYLAQAAPEQHRKAFCDMLKTWSEQNTSIDIYRGNSIFVIEQARKLVKDASERERYIGVKFFPSMDRAVMHRENFAFGLSMYSTNRTKSYESINGENLKGFYTSAGALYLYNDDFSQFEDGYWGSVDPYRLPGVTSVNGMDIPAASVSDNFAGGAVLDGMYGVAGMYFKPKNNDIAARKSYFMFDDELVAVGIVNPLGGTAAQTVLDNRKIKEGNVLTVDGVQRAKTKGQTEACYDTTWLHLSGSEPGTDIGYYLPTPAKVNALRDTRTVKWTENNTKFYPDEDGVQKRDYMTLWLDHRANFSESPYAYAILPGKSAEQMEAYSQNPDISVVAIEPGVHAVTEKTLGITAANFWGDTKASAAGITCDKRASVIMRESGGELAVAVADPTWENKGKVTIQIDKAAESLISADPNIKVVSQSPKLVLEIDVKGLRGASSTAKFKLAKPAFRDVDASHWAYEYVTTLAEAGVLSGVSEDSFNPDGNVTREEFAKLIVGALGLELSYGASPFLDVDANAWYAPYVAAAAQAGIILGSDDGTFGVGRYITRQEMAVMVYRSGIQLADKVDPVEFIDSGEIADWAREAISAMQRAGILSGDSYGAFLPNDNATRAQAAKVVYEVMKLAGRL